MRSSMFNRSRSRRILNSLVSLAAGFSMSRKGVAWHPKKRLRWKLPGTTNCAGVVRFTRVRGRGLSLFSFLCAQHTFLNISVTLFCTTRTLTVQLKLSSYMFYWTKCCMCSYSLFFTPVHFHLGGRQHFSFSHRRYEMFMFFFQWNGCPLFLISRSSSFSVFHVNVDIKTSRKKNSALLLHLFLLKSAGAHTIYRRNVRGAWSEKFHHSLHEGVYLRTYGRFCQNQNFLDA